MPNKNKKKHVKKARPTFRKRKVPQGTISCFPASRSTQLRYCDAVSNFTSTNGAITEYFMSCNSLFDPNRTASGHQPMGFDQWSALYNQYYVTSARIKIKLLADQANTAPCIVGIYLTDGTSTPYTSASEFIEAKKGVYKMFAHSGSREVNLSYPFNAKKYFDVNDIKDNTKLQAPITASPAEEAFFVIWYSTLDGTTETANMMITVDYNSHFTEPKDLGQS